MGCAGKCKVGSADPSNTGIGNLFMQVIDLLVMQTFAKNEKKWKKGEKKILRARSFGSSGLFTTHDWSSAASI